LAVPEANATASAKDGLVEGFAALCLLELSKISFRTSKSLVPVPGGVCDEDQLFAGRLKRFLFFALVGLTLTSLGRDAASLNSKTRKRRIRFANLAVW
jgi:hypothetical protein